MNLTQLNRPEMWVTSPWETLTELHQELDRLLSAPWGPYARAGEVFRTWAPALDMFEDDANLVVQLELPGVSKENIQVSIHEGVLTIAGERQPPKDADQGETFRQERFHGRFQRSISLPKPVNVEAVRANLKDGVLTITLPKAEEARPRQIQVNAE